jgi:hypothetical protein
MALHVANPAVGPVISRSTMMMLRRVLNAYREGWLLEDRLAVVARMAVEDARRRGLAAEGMLVALKGEWAELAEARALPGFAGRDLLRRLVTRAIATYYEAAPGAAAAPSRGAA